MRQHGASQAAVQKVRGWINADKIIMNRRSRVSSSILAYTRRNIRTTRLFGLHANDNSIKSFPIQFHVFVCVSVSCVCRVCNGNRTLFNMHYMQCHIVRI